MKYSIIILFIGLLIKTPSFSQNTGIYTLNSMENLLTPEVKSVLEKDLKSKRIVLLGESAHHVGSDFVAKTEFVKYLVTEQGYKNIAFESDFFALYFDHDKNNTWQLWAWSPQCKELFSFLSENNVTIWGFDNQPHASYSYEKFTMKFIDFLQQNKIPYDEKTINLIDTVIKFKVKTKNEIDKNDIEYLLSNLDIFIKNETVQNHKLWLQILESFKSAVLIYTSKNESIGIPIRDTQMASNLNFITDSFPIEKFIVWAANAHISKLNLEVMKGETMGYQYLMMNPESTYHIAFAPIKMPYRTDKFLLKKTKDPNDLLNLLPSIDENYFLDSKRITENNPTLLNKTLQGMFFGTTGKKDKTLTTWFKHFDALVFIAKGEQNLFKF